jgi:nickel and cobalt resistance protein CnrR
VSHEHARSSAGLTAADSEERFHDWVHEHLSITPEQDAALHSTEQAFADRRRSLRTALHTANESLRAAILRDHSDSAAVQQAVQHLAAAQAALQQATLEHLFEMADKLDAARREQLLHWLHDSLRPPP